ncbi:DNA glycosylase AlkZ-like family protein [Acinetobacter baumannii]|uniref:DNA glycosylase AlkZ-like family protein n=1 Tax=Acinetobacter baumannii TaxID=470 RepID=UPI0023400844|nr:hypothetical protein [Acinetobacter baumannii]
MNNIYKWQDILEYNLYYHFQNEESDVVAIINKSLGLHASREKGPFIALAARLDKRKFNQNSLNIALKDYIIKQPSFRCTLYIFDIHNAERYSIATFSMRVKKKLASLKRQGVTKSQIDRAQIILTKGIKEGISAKNLYNLLWESYKNELLFFKEGERKALNGLIRLYWDLGFLYIKDHSASWLNEERFFYINHDYQCNHINEELEFESLIDICKDYIFSYGPVTIKDITKWLGMSEIKVLKIISRIDNLINFELCDSNKKMIWTNDAFEKFLDFRARPPKLIKKTVFLAYEDAFMKAYWDTRERFLYPHSLSNIYYSTGESKATIFYNNKLVGCWEWSKNLKSNILHLSNELDEFDKKEISIAHKNHNRFIESLIK